MSNIFTRLFGANANSLRPKIEATPEYEARWPKKTPRTITKIMIHCSDSDSKFADDVSNIDRWHLENGWKGVGYHYFIRKDGLIQKGRPDTVMGSHVKGHNRYSLGICLHGKKRFAKEQAKSLTKLLKYLKFTYDINNEFVYGHRFFNKDKTCPNFDVAEFLNTKKIRLDYGA